MKLTTILILTILPVFLFSQVSFPKYEEELIRYEILDSLTYEIELEYYSGREDVEHRILESKHYTIDTSEFYFVIVGSTIGEGLDCNACGSVLTLFNYSIQDSEYRLLEYNHVGQYGNLGKYPLNVSFYTTKNDDLLLQISWLAFSPGGHVSEYLSMLIVMDNDHHEFEHLFDFDLSNYKKYNFPSKFHLNIDHLDHNNYTTTFSNITNEKIFMEIFSNNSNHEVYVVEEGESKLIEVVSKGY